MADILKTFAKQPAAGHPASPLHLTEERRKWQLNLSTKTKIGQTKQRDIGLTLTDKSIALQIRTIFLHFLIAIGCLSTATMVLCRRAMLQIKKYTDHCRLLLLHHHGYKNILTTKKGGRNRPAPLFISSAFFFSLAWLFSSRPFYRIQSPSAFAPLFLI